jgi:hypothetical protein
MTSHDVRVAIGSLLLAAACGSSGDTAHAQAAVRQRILGAWELQSRTVANANGETLIDPIMGQQPAGRLFYDASGRMALLLMRQGRMQPIGADAANPRLALGYDAYFGTFQVNERDQTITHHVEGSLFPEDLGKDFQRALKVDGDALTLSFTLPSTDGSTVTRSLRFRRFR